MNSGERPPASFERRGNDESSLAQQLEALSEEEAALLTKQLGALDPLDPDYVHSKLTVLGTTLNEIEEARQLKGESNE